MNHLYIDNRPIDTLEDLKSLMDAFREAKNDSPLFIDVIDNFVDGNIDAFLRSINEAAMAERIKGIKPTNGDSQIRQKLIAAICNVRDETRINPLKFVEVLRADILDNKALLEVKIIKKAVETIDIGISAPQVSLTKSLSINIQKHYTDEILKLEMEVLEREFEYKVAFTIGDIEVKTILYDGGNLHFYVGGVGFTMIKVEGGPMQTYYIGETQVTNELWDAVMSKTMPSSSSLSEFIDLSTIVSSLLETAAKTTPRCKKPVVNLNWYNCREFTKEINKILMKKMPKGYVFRLPTEAQWEYAAIGGNKSRGYKYSGCTKQGLKNHAWFDENSGGEIHDVKTLLPNELEIYDMSGNVWEWCHDYFNNARTSHVTRGGSWKVNSGYQQVSYRRGKRPDDYDVQTGFRLALVHIEAF